MKAHLHPGAQVPAANTIIVHTGMIERYVIFHAKCRITDGPNFQTCVIHSTVVEGSNTLRSSCVLSGDSVNYRVALSSGCLGPPQTVETPRAAQQKPCRLFQTMCASVNSFYPEGSLFSPRFIDISFWNCASQVYSGMHFLDMKINGLLSLALLMT